MASTAGSYEPQSFTTVELVVGIRLAKDEHRVTATTAADDIRPSIWCEGHAVASRAEEGVVPSRTRASIVITTTAPKPVTTTSTVQCV